MKNYSFGTPLSIRWHFAKPDGTPFDLGGFSYRLKYRCGRGTGYAQSTLLPSLGNVLVWTFPAEEQRFTGIYDLELTLFEGGRKHSVCKYVGAFSLEKKLPEAQVVHEIVSGINQTPAESLDGPAAVIDATLNDLEYTDETVPEIVDLFTAAEWFACSYVMPMAGSDGYWRYNGEVIRDDKGTPVRWKPNIVVTDEVPALGDTEEGVIYRIMDGQEFTDYAMVDGDIVSVDSGRLLDLEAKVNNLKAEDVAYNGSLPASTVKEALDNVARNKASQSQVDTMMTTKADKSQVATLNQDVVQMGYDLTQKASKAKVEELEETVTSHGERLCTIDDVLGTKATVGELANVNSAVAVNAQGIVDVNERIDSLKAQDIFYKGGGTVQTAIDKVRTNKQEKLVSGENIKTINGDPVLGNGNIEIQGVLTQGDALMSVVPTAGDTHAYGLKSVALGQTTMAGNPDKIIVERNDPRRGDEDAGYGAFASGIMSYAKGRAAFAEGENTEAIGAQSHAEGNHTKANGKVAHAEGSYTEANGEHSHAEGHETKANKRYSHAEGGNTIADGDYSHTEGKDTRTGKGASHAEGLGTETSNTAEHAEGKYNKSNTGTMHSVGIGTSATKRKNAFEVMDNGDIYAIGIGGYDGTNPSSATRLQDSLGGGSEVIEIPYVNSTTDQATVKEVCMTLAANPNGKFVVVEGSKKRDVVAINDISQPSFNFYNFYLTVADDSDKWLEQISVYGADESETVPSSFWGASNNSIKNAIPSISGLQKETYRQNVLTSSKTNYPSSKGVIDYVSGQLSPIYTQLGQKASVDVVNGFVITLTGAIGGKADKMRYDSTFDPGLINLECEPNTYYYITELLDNSHYIMVYTQMQPTDEVVIEFFTGATAPTLEWQDVAFWVGGDPVIEANKHYLVSVVKGIGIIVEV